MGSPDGNNGGLPPDGGAPEGLPGLPPEWGHIVVPDDASALADEAAAVRAELRRRRRQARRSWRTPPVPGRTGQTGIRAPMLIMTVAVLVTLASLFTAALPGLRPPVVQRTAAASPGRELPALDLVAADGRAVALRSLLPAVILLVDGCRCDDLTTATVGAAPAGITVVAVTARAGGSAAPADRGPATAPAAPAAPPPGPTVTVRRLTDPAGGLRTAFALPEPDGSASALLVGRDGTIVRSVHRTRSVDDFRGDLVRL